MTIRCGLPPYRECFAQSKRTAKGRAMMHPLLFIGLQLIGFKPVRDACGVMRWPHKRLPFGLIRVAGRWRLYRRN